MEVISGVDVVGAEELAREPITDPYDTIDHILNVTSSFGGLGFSIRGWISAGLRLLEQQAQESAAELEALRRDVQEGIDAYERDDYTSLRSPEDVDRFSE